MKADQFTQKAREAFELAIAIAARRSNPEVLPPHLLAALLEQTDSLIAPLLGDTAAIRAQANAAIDALPVLGTESEPTTSGELMAVLRRADDERAKLGDDYVSV